jgi:hypothetical protein
MNPNIAAIVNQYFMNPQANRNVLVTQAIYGIGQDILNNYTSLLTVQQENCLRNFFPFGEFNNDYSNDFFN